MSSPPPRKLSPLLLALLGLVVAAPLRAEPSAGVDGPPTDPPAGAPGPVRSESPAPGAAALLGPQPLVLPAPLEEPRALLSAPPAPVPPPLPATSDVPDQNQARLLAAPAAPPPDRTLVLDRRRRVLQVLEQGKELKRFPVAVGMPGWETPVGRFEVIEKTANPVWEHPANGRRYPSGPDNPLGSRWIGFHRDCKGRSGFNGQEHLEVKGCVTAGFHGTPNRDSVGQAVSHGCVRLFDEHARELFDLVRIGTPVDVLP